MANKVDIEALQTEILNTLEKNGKIEDSANFMFNGQVIDQLVFLGALNSLNSKEMITYKQIENEKWVLTEEGNEIANTGSHEAKVFYAIPEGEEGISIAELNSKVGPSAKIGQGKAFKNRWISKKGKDTLIRIVSSIEDKTQMDLKVIRETNNYPDANIIKDMKKRKLIDRQKITTYSVEKGEKFTTKIVKQATDITYEMIQNGSWKDVSFKKYNFDAEGIQPKGGYLHPLMKVREEFRQIFFQMGFSEMPTNKFVESSFWNFDALFQPQQHPARDMQDTFFLKDPATTNDFPEDYLERVRKTHSEGGYGSIGYGYDWSREETQKLILRTHTTAVSSHMLYTLAQHMKDGKFSPAKYFSIDRVFRNETVDATHLAEFHQVEGFIADYNINLGDLIGVLDDFFKRMGVNQIKFKPAYNPYTEPSMEIFSYHEGLGEWVEIGNSGMFRPEMLRPMGVPDGVRVIAWGLSLERPTMIKYSIDNIRELLGHKCDINMIQNNPICRLEKKMGREL